MSNLKFGSLQVILLIILFACDKDKSATDSSAPDPPDRVFVERIRINQIPFADERGEGWDLFSGPDLFADLATSSDIVFTLRPYVHIDVAPSDLPIQWSLSSGYEITNWSTVYSILVWDHDELGDDLIGASNGFRIVDVINTEGYATTIMRQNTSGTIETVVTLRWQ